LWKHFRKSGRVSSFVEAGNALQVPEKNKKGAFYSQITTQSKSTALSTQYKTIKQIYQYVF
jgi:hypothetical protein